MRLKYCFYSQTSHPKAKNRSTRDRKICDTQKKKKKKKNRHIRQNVMSSQNKLIHMVSRKERKNKCIQNDLQPAMILHFLFPGKRNT